MRSAAAFLTSVLAATSVTAIQITSPSKHDKVSAATGFEVKWTTVSTDPTTAHLFLVNMAGGHTPYSKDLGEVDLSTGSTVVNEKDIPDDNTWQVNFQSIETHNTGILAQSEQFTIQAGAAGGSDDDDEKNTSSAADDNKTATATQTSSMTVPTGSTTAPAAAHETDATKSGAGGNVTGTGSLTASSSAAATSGSLVESGADAKKSSAMLEMAVAGVVA
ncbi:hypothetical protein QBC42DRAFT_147852, partial [Cladorrhinum samala]